jgi:putative flavoprotein involved in K+ transport
MTVVTVAGAARTHFPVLVIGGGQAGLSMSAVLKQRGVDHLVFETHRVGHAWRTQRWDSFCLVTPNWQCQLPGFDYVEDFGGADPHGFMVKDEIVGYFDGFVAKLAPPVREGVAVTALARDAAGHFRVATSIGDYTADNVVVAVGGYHTPKVPRLAERLPSHIVQLHAINYKSPDALPPGEVLVVGSGQSGCQIAEDLHLAGRRVHLAVGSAPRCPRIYRGRDCVDWLADMGQYDLPVDQHPLGEKVRMRANHYVTGRDGGREIDLRKFALEGMVLHGRLKDYADGRVSFHADLKHNLDAADATYVGIGGYIDKYIAENGIDAPPAAEYRAVWEPVEEAVDLDLAGGEVTSVIWCTGLAPDFGWIEVPVFDGKGYPGHKRGVTDVPGLYFLGLPWLHTWGSGRFCGVGKDAMFLGQQLDARLARPLAAACG